MATGDPMSLDELLTELDDPAFTAYVCIAADGELAWKIALGAQKMIPNVRSYRVAPSDAAPVRKEFGVPSSTVGLVFGYGRDVKFKLTKAKADDALTVFNAIWDSD